MIKVFLREKKLLHGKRGLYLDFYPAIENAESGKRTRREHLGLYVFERPKTEPQREHNRESRLIGENIRSQRQLDLQAGAFGFSASRNKNKDFLEYVALIAEQKKPLAATTHRRWLTVLYHLRAFAPSGLRFGGIDKNRCRAFREHLRNHSNLNQNSASAYFETFRSAVRQATGDHLLPLDPTISLDGIPLVPSQRNYLSLEELKSLSAAVSPCNLTKRAGLFSALTGIRYSDLVKMVWSEVRFSDAQGSFVEIRQRKTKDPITHPISDQALDLLGSKQDSNQSVFPGLSRERIRLNLPIWLTAAGIGKKFTFHGFRHTYATLQLTLGTDLYTVSKMLGHHDIRTTQIYAKIIDEKKREAADRISLK